jgi:hypothetical protein
MMNLIDYVKKFYTKRSGTNFYSEAAIRELEEVLMEGSVQGQIEEDIVVGPSYSSSSISPAASGGRVTAKVGLNKLGAPFFRKLDIKEEEFFKKEEFDIEE